MRVCSVRADSDHPDCNEQSFILFPRGTETYLPRSQEVPIVLGTKSTLNMDGCPSYCPSYPSQLVDNQSRVRLSTNQLERPLGYTVYN